MSELKFKITNVLQNAHSFPRRWKKDIMCLWGCCTLKWIWVT